MKKIKSILIVSAFIPPHVGGVEKFADKISRNFSKRNVKVTTLSTNFDNSACVLEFDNIYNYKLPTFRIFKNRYPLLKKNKEYRNIIKKINKQKFDLVIINARFYTISLLGAKISNKKNIPCFLIEHGSSHLSVNNKVLDFFGQIYEHAITAVLKNKITKSYGVSQAACKWQKHFNIENNGVIYNCVDICETNTIKNRNDKIIIGFAGRLIKDKGIDILLRIFDDLSKKYMIELHIAGKGPEISLLNDYISKNKNIKYFGLLDSNGMGKFYDDIDIFINPSKTEGLPTCILEAGIHNCAVIATDVGGTSEIISCSKEGVLVPFDEKSIYLALEKMILSRKEIEHYKKALYKKVVEKFSTDCSVDKIIEEYNKL